MLNGINFSWQIILIIYCGILLVFNTKSFRWKLYSLKPSYSFEGMIWPVLIISASYFLSNQKPDLENLSAYECGFEPYEDTRHTFDMNFSVIAILFIIFDIEVMFLIPWCVSVSNLDLLGFWSMIDFLLELGVGLFYVWYVNALDWD